MIARSFLDCWFLTGVTASGKTVIGLDLAQRLQAEIIALDSMTVYRGMDIGTAKPTREQRRRVPHHAIDVVDPDVDFSLASYLELATRCVEEIRSRGKEVLFVGGTPLYLKAMLRGVDTGPPADWEFRRQIREEVAQVGVQALHERLQQVDPLSASKLPSTDLRRITRALEVYRVTGRPLSHQQTHFEEGTPAAECRVFVLAWPRRETHRRVADRVEEMFQAGFVAEVRELQRRFQRLGRTASQAVGYQEVLSYLEGGSDLETVKQRIRARTRQFAKRQTTWFRGLCECRFIPCDEGRSSADVAQEGAGRRCRLMGRLAEPVELQLFKTNQDRRMPATLLCHSERTRGAPKPYMR